MARPHYNKYRNVTTERDGVMFASKKEAARYQELKVQQHAGWIRDLIVQPRFPLIVNEVKIAVYIADFQYVECETGQTVVEDCKGGRGTITPVYRLKKKLMFALYLLDVVEV